MAWNDPYTWSVHPIPLAGGNEIVLAYSERIQALGGSAVAPLSDGDDAQDGAYFGSIQSWCEGACTSFIDHTAPTAPLTPDGTALLFFTLDTWRAAAGLPADGFRRCNAKEADGVTPIFTTGGVIQPDGDYHGPWNFEDLQKGLGALKWTSWNNTNHVIEEKIGSGNDSPAGYGNYLAGYAMPWAPSSEAIYRVYAQEWGGGYYAPPILTGHRCRSQFNFNMLPEIPANIEIYVVCNGTDCDGLGFTDDVPFVLNIAGQSYSYTGGGTFNTKFGDFEADPWSAFGMIPLYGGTETGQSNDVIGHYQSNIMKWIFTNS